MGSVGDCFDHALIESFFATLECELIDRRHWRTRDQARMDVFWWIQATYNRTRRHSRLGYLSPVDYQAMLRRAAATSEPSNQPLFRETGAGPNQPASTPTRQQFGRRWIQAKTALVRVRRRQPHGGVAQPLCAGAVGARPHQRAVAGGGSRRPRASGAAVSARCLGPHPLVTQPAGSGRGTPAAPWSDGGVHRREIPVDQRQPLIQAYLRRYRKLPRVAATFRKLPDPADHPAFRIVKSQQADRRSRRRD